MIYDPFKSAQDISPEQVYEYRGAIFKYKEQIKKNFNTVKQVGFLAVNLLNNFATDTHVIELINAFKDIINEMEKKVNILLDILDDLKAADFKDKLIQSIDNIKKTCFEIEKMVKDRIEDYINSNILSKDWMSDISKDEHFKKEIKEKVPYVTQLLEERQKALEG